MKTPPALEDRLMALERISFALRSSEMRMKLVSSLHTAIAKPLSWCEAEVDFCLESFAAQAPEFREAYATQTLSDGQRRSEIHYGALGTVLIFSPFNSPLECLQLALLPALAAGNRVIVKASELAEEPVRLYLEPFRSELGEQIQYISGGASVGASLVARDDVELIVFTGSQAVGREIAAAAGRALKPVILELGGKDALIVRADADLDAAVDSALAGAFGFAGQVCTAIEEVWLDAEVAGRFEAQLLSRVREKLGAGWSERLITETARDRVQRAITEAIQAGAKLLCGGTPDAVDPRGLAPAILKDVPRATELGQKEIFGPVLCLKAFSSEDDLVAALARSPYALGLTIFTADEDWARTLALRLPNAMVGINGGVIGVQGTPWLGNRRSGLGMLGSIEGHRLFTRRQVLTFSPTPRS